MASARGWHGAQLAVLAFIGLCGVLSDPDPEVPRSVQVTAGVLALVALTLACVATFVVARVAWPLSAGSGAALDAVDAGRRLRVGVGVTFLAVAAMALAASAGWWPVHDAGTGGAGTGDGATVEVTVQNGDTACGTLVDAPAGTVRLATAEGTVEVASDRLVAVTPVDGC